MTVCEVTAPSQEIKHQKQKTQTVIFTHYTVLYRFKKHDTM